MLFGCPHAPAQDFAKRAIGNVTAFLGAGVIDRYRVKIRDPSFVNLQALPAMIEGYLIADTVASVASIDPVLGGVDR